MEGGRHVNINISVGCFWREGDCQSVSSNDLFSGLVGNSSRIMRLAGLCYSRIQLERLFSDSCSCHCPSVNQWLLFKPPIFLGDFSIDLASVSIFTHYTFLVQYQELRMQLSG